MNRLKNASGGGQSQSQLVPAGRLGDTRDIANTTVFLFSDAASFITGQVIAVDGGNEHLRATQLPYPPSVLDPQSIKHMVPRL